MKKTKKDMSLEQAKVIYYKDWVVRKMGRNSQSATQNVTSAVLVARFLKLPSDIAAIQQALDELVEEGIMFVKSYLIRAPKKYAGTYEDRYGLHEDVVINYDALPPCVEFKGKTYLPIDQPVFSQRNWPHNKRRDLITGEIYEGKQRRYYI